MNNHIPATYVGTIWFVLPTGRAADALATKHRGAAIAFFESLANAQMSQMHGKFTMTESWTPTSARTVSTATRIDGHLIRQPDHRWN